MALERNSRRILARLKREGWVLEKVEGSHHKMREPVSRRIIIVPHPKKDLAIGAARNIAKHAGWLEDE